MSLIHWIGPDLQYSALIFAPRDAVHKRGIYYPKVSVRLSVLLVSRSGIISTVSSVIGALNWCGWYWDLSVYWAVRLRLWYDLLISQSRQFDHQRSTLGPAMPVHNYTRPSNGCPQAFARLRPSVLHGNSIYMY